jgi:hypothetical protein
MKLQNLHATIQTFVRRPRYLRAIPSLVLLTTAMAWGVAPDDADASDPMHKKARVTLTQPAVVAGQDAPVLRRD